MDHSRGPAANGLPEGWISPSRKRALETCLDVVGELARKPGSPERLKALEFIRETLGAEFKQAGLAPAAKD